MTDSCKRWPAHLMKMVVRRSPPEGCRVVPGSTPVVSFGDPVRATVATIGFNPSALEFRESWTGPMLPEDQRRLATLESLGISDYQEINCSLGAKILDECAGYFGRNPYEKWFLPLDCILRAGARASYYADTRSDALYLDLACHLDLSPWATSCGWSDLGASAQEILLKDGKDEDGILFLHQQLLQGDYRLVIVNGSGVKKEMKRFLPEWEERNHPNVPSDVKLHECQFGDTQILAWSRHIQKKQDLKHIPALARFVAERYAEFQNERRTT